tara:strand:- start:373 stop:612 length:240 start_codon:yes stop_codon:yes gene_type:complete
MKVIDWIKSFFASKAVQDKAEEAVEEVKQIVTEKAEEVKDKVESKVTDIRRTAKKRARDKLGRFIADNPDTKENEAYKD